MRDLFPGFDAYNVIYTGVDIIRPEIRRLRSEFKNDSRRTFRVVDLTKGHLPRADLIVSRQALQHMPAADALRALHNFGRSGARYLLTTSYMISEKLQRYHTAYLGPGKQHLANMMVTDGPHMNFIDLEGYPYSTHPRNRNHALWASQWVPKIHS